MVSIKVTSRLDKSSYLLQFLDVCNSWIFPKLLWHSSEWLASGLQQAARFSVRQEIRNWCRFDNIQLMSCEPKNTLTVNPLSWAIEIRLQKPSLLWGCNADPTAEWLIDLAELCHNCDVTIAARLYRGYHPRQIFCWWIVGLIFRWDTPQQEPTVFELLRGRALELITDVWKVIQIQTDMDDPPCMDIKRSFLDHQLSQLDCFLWQEKRRDPVILHHSKQFDHRL